MDRPAMQETGVGSPCNAGDRGWIALQCRRPGLDRPAMQETGVGSLSQEDPLEKEMATHSSILAWKIPWTEGHGL